MSDYVPVACGVHDRLERAVLRKQTLSVVWRDESGAIHQSTMVPLDIVTCHGSEYLHYEDAQGDQALRLDRIISF